MIDRFICHSYSIAKIAIRYGWLPGARYTNLRDVKRFDRLGFLDCDWNNYDYKKHLEAAKSTRPRLTIARDILDACELNQILEEAFELSQWCDEVALVPKDPKLINDLPIIIPSCFLLAYSVPTQYGRTTLPEKCFKSRKIHLLGGHPAKQRDLANELHVVSIDCNRFTIDAAFGDYFDGNSFRPHPQGGYLICIEQSISNINKIWYDYFTY